VSFKVKVKSSFYSDREGFKVDNLVGQILDVEDFSGMFGFPAYRETATGYIVHQDDCELQLEMFDGNIVVADWDTITWDALAKGIDSHTDSLWGIDTHTRYDNKCCDEPDIKSNTAMGKSFYVCSNCKREVTKEGRPV
jgi:hypothetical protein